MTYQAETFNRPELRSDVVCEGALWNKCPIDKHNGDESP